MGRDPGRRKAEGANGRTRRRHSPRPAGIYDHIRKAPVRKRDEGKPVGNVDEAFRNAARVVEAEYEWPFQSHASMGPACALVEIKDGQATCWTGSQKSHFVRDGVAVMLGLPPEKVRAIWVPGPGAYGRNDAGDAAMDAAVLAKATGRPVRLQYMRDQGTGWDPKGPASIHRARAAIDAAGNVIGYDFLSKGFSRIDVLMNESKAADTLAGHLLGAKLKVNDGFGVPAEVYEFANKRVAWETIAPLLERASPLRSAICAIRSGRRSISPRSPSWTRWRMRSAPIRSSSGCKHLKAPRDIAVIKAAAERAGWQTRTSPRRDRPATPCRAAASRIRSATARCARSSPRSTSTAPRARSGRASSRSRMIAGRSSIRTGW